MNYLEVIEDSIKSLRTHGFEDAANAISEAQVAAATGSELLLSVLSTFLKLKQTDTKAYTVVSREVTMLTTYAHAIGLYPK